MGGEGQQWTKVWLSFCLSLEGADLALWPMYVEGRSDLETPEQWRIPKNAVFCFGMSLDFIEKCLISQFCLPLANIIVGLRVASTH